MKVDVSRFEVRLAKSDEDIAAAQRLRYKVFVEEMGAQASPEEHTARQERDKFDPYFEHLLLIDKQSSGDPLDKVCGVYRLMRGSAARSGIGFYSASEYDLEKIEDQTRETLELGRSCVAEEHRGGIGMHLMWDGLGDYVTKHEIGVMFGVASFHTADPEPIAEALAYLHHNHIAPPELRVKALPDNFADMNLIPADKINKRRALQLTPSLIKAYIRLGGYVGEGAYVDHDFNTVDVCLIMDTQTMTERYRAFYGRKRGT